MRRLHSWMQLLMMCQHSWDLRMGLETQMKPLQSLNQLLDGSWGGGESHISSSQHLVCCNACFPFYCGPAMGMETLAHTSWILFFLLVKDPDLCWWVGFVRERWTLTGYNLAIVESGPADFLTTFFTLWMPSEFWEFCSVFVSVCDWMSSYPIYSLSLSRFGHIPG